MGHCIATWYAMARSLVKLTEIGTSWGVGGVTVTQKSRLILTLVTAHLLAPDSINN